MKRMCSYCLKRPAKSLPRIDGAVETATGKKSQPFFCSEKCAAIYAVEDRIVVGRRHCEKHGWYITFCPRCEWFPDDSVARMT